jgi:subtilisin family serine protease
MADPAFQSEAIPEYHEGVLILKVRSMPREVGPVVARMGASMAGFGSQEMTRALQGSPGLSALSGLERAGLIRRVVPLSRPAEQRAPMGVTGAMGSLVASVEVPSKEDRNAGVNLVEVQNDGDVPNLQKSLADDPNIEYVSRVPVRYLAVDAPGAAASSPPASAMWKLQKIRWQEARALQNFREADGVQVAVLDTGIDMSHPDLSGQVDSYVFDHPDFAGTSSEQDIIGHGTHVAGTIAANNANALGIDGVCNCRLRIWKIFDDIPDLVRGFPPHVPARLVYFVDTVMYQRALADCLDEGVDVINLSIGGRGLPDQNELGFYRQLLENGTTVVAAMGNERQSGSATSYPAAIPGVMAVGATNIDDTVANFSNRGNHISLCAPGVAIWSTMPTYAGQTEFAAVPGPGGAWLQGSPRRRETDYDALSGTSMASPHVAGAAALLLATKGHMSPADVRDRLMSKTDKVGAMHGSNFDSDYGAGRLNLASALGP